MLDRNTLRQQLRQARRSVAPATRRVATKAALARIRRLPRFLRAQHVAFYAGADGEICPLRLLDEAATLGKATYLPVLHPFREGRLWFCAWRPHERLQRNRFGITEPIPTAGKLISPRRLDLVIVPLLAFDTFGNRLGMGGGFYDRTFAFRVQHPSLHRPYLVGLAHELQRVDRLISRHWDVGLDAVVTEKRLYLFKRRRR